MRVTDLFCGAGGLAEGFRQAGFRILAGNDLDPDACATFRLNFPEAALVAGDIRNARVRQELLEAAADSDVVVGGPPCQAFSQMRNHSRLIDDPRNSLYREFVGVVAKLEPSAFLMENVPGLDQMGVRDQILEDLSLRGAYRVGAHVVDAADFGVPQTRRRILFLGVHSSLSADPPILRGSGAAANVWLERRQRNGSVRYAVSGPAELRAMLQDRQDATLVSAGQALSDLELLRAGTRGDTLTSAQLAAPSSEYQRKMREGIGEFISNVSVPRINRDTVLRLSGLPAGGNYRDLSDSMRRRYLTGKRWGPHNGSGHLGRRHYYAYRRLHAGIWSWTLNTKADSVYHYRLKRALSVREFARLQSFPDRFVFTTDPARGPLPGRIEGGAAHSRYRQAGNAVPPLLARTAAGAISSVLSASERSTASA